MNPQKVNSNSKLKLRMDYLDPRLCSQGGRQTKLPVKNSDKRRNPLFLICYAGLFGILVYHVRTLVRARPLNFLKCVFLDYFPHIQNRNVGGHTLEAVSCPLM